MTVSPPTLYWYQLDTGTVVPNYFVQLDTCVRALCTENSVTLPTARLYPMTTGTLFSTWLYQTDAAVRTLCTALSVTPPHETIKDQTVGQYESIYWADLDACVRLLCDASGGYTTTALTFSAVTTGDEASYESVSTLSTTDSPFILASLWYRNPRAPTSPMGYAFTSITGYYYLHLYLDHTEVEYFDSSGLLNYLARIDTAPPIDTNWHHFIWASDTNHSAHSKITTASLDGVAQTVLEGTDNSSAFDVAWTIEPAYVGLNASSSSKRGKLDMADVWIGMGQYADASSATVVNKFRDPGTGKPISLGANGELPTGTSPTIFFKGDTSTFANPNLGTGGSFNQEITAGGTITNASTSPSD